MGKEGVDYGFIHIDQIDRDWVHGSSLMWHKGSDKLYVLGDIPHRKEILLTRALINELIKVLDMAEEGDQKC